MGALVLRDVKKKYPNGLEALKGIDIDVAQGDFFGLLGPNGAGKSTAIGIIASLVKKTSGKISIFGEDLDKSPTKARAFIGLVPQEFNFNPFERVEDILINQAGYYGILSTIAKKRAEQYLARLGLLEKAKMPATMLSGGMKRRLLIARGLIHEPRLLILDEPTAGVDIELRRSLWDFLQEVNKKGTTVILTTHYLEEAENLCKHIAIIHNGNIIENTSVKQLMTKLHRETLILDVNVKIRTLPFLPGCEFSQSDDSTLQVSFQQGVSMHDLFSALHRLGYEVMSLRNKTNRLEELFLDLIKFKERDESELS